MLPESSISGSADMNLNTNFSPKAIVALALLTAWLGGIGLLAVSSLYWTPLLAGIWGGSCAFVLLFKRGADVTHDLTQAAPRQPRASAKELFVRVTSLAARLVIVALVATVSSVSIFVLASVRWDPIGVGNDLGLPPCKTANLSSVRGPSGEVGIVRRTQCSGAWLTGQVSYFVFVHSASEPSSRKNLAFRYTPTYEKLNDPPKIAWLSSTVMRIESGAGDILQVTEQQNTVNGIHVLYTLQTPVYSPATKWWQRPFGPRTD